jgi:hypothetical protein
MLPITMGCDFLHPPSYMSLMIGFGNTQQQNRRFIHNDNKIQESGFELIPINNSPLGPLLDTPFSCGKLNPHLCPCPPTIDITFYLLKFKNTIHILHHLAIATFISTLCIN